MKWDLTTVSSLYLVALVQDRSIRSLRDLNRNHLGLLNGIRREASRIVKERWELGIGSLRMYVHYQPSYCMSSSLPILIQINPQTKFLDHFHVHIVNVNYEGGLLGMTVGRAHLLDDIISLVSRYHVMMPCSYCYSWNVIPQVVLQSFRKLPCHMY